MLSAQNPSHAKKVTIAKNFKKLEDISNKEFILKILKCNC